MNAKPFLSPQGRRFVWAWFLVVALFTLAAFIDLLPHAGRMLWTPAQGPEQVAQASEIISDCGRTLGVMLSMLVALCALAIPLTANVYTPKLIEIFVADRLNRVVLGYFVLANAIALWNKLVVSGAQPEDARARAMFCLVLTAAAVLSIAPYFLYVLRFLVPRSIVSRLQQEVVQDLVAVTRATEPEDQHRALDAAVTNVQYMGKITLRSVERFDRDTAYEGLQALREVFDAYQARKEFLPRGFLSAKCKELLGLGPELALEVEREHATLEVAILQELGQLYAVAMSRLPETIAQIAALVRHFGVRAAERGDQGALEMVMLHFNTFLRQALKGRAADAFYKFVYQYRRLAEDLLDLAPAQAARVGFYLDYYGHQAVRMGLGYLINVVAYDLAALCEVAYKKRSGRRGDLLQILIDLDRDQTSLVDMPGIIKAQIILAAKLRTRGEQEPYERIASELKKVPSERLKEAFSQVIAAREENFWEIADRRRHLDHIEPEYRAAVSELRGVLLGVAEPGTDTLLFLSDRAAEPPREDARPRRPGTRRPERGPASAPAAPAAPSAQPSPASAGEEVVETPPVGGAP